MRNECSDKHHLFNNPATSQDVPRQQIRRKLAYRLGKHLSRTYVGKRMSGDPGEHRKKHRDGGFEEAEANIVQALVEVKYATQTLRG